MIKYLILASVLASAYFYETKAQVVLEALEAPEKVVNSNTENDTYPPESRYRGVTTAGCGGGQGISMFNITVNIRYTDKFVSTRSFQCSDSDFILDCAEEMGISLPYSDRAGASSASVGRLVYGMVDNRDGSFLDPFEDWPRGWFLTDTSYACTDLEFDTGYYMEQFYHEYGNRYMN